MADNGSLRKAPLILGAFFILLTLAVHLRLLAGSDYSAGLWVRSADMPPLDAVATPMSVAFSGELSVLYGLAATVVLWRMGAGWWSLAPLGFLAVTPVEVVLKEVVHQLPPPPELTRPHLYPMIIHSTDFLEGAFPSGYVMRVSFFMVFLATLLWSDGSRRNRIAAGFCVLIALVLTYSRVYVGWHWLSDVVGGFLLGSTAALILAPEVATRLGIRHSQAPT